MLKHARSLTLRWVAPLAATLLAATQLSAQSVSAPLAVTTFAGTAGERQVTNGTGTAARFYSPAGLALDANGDLIVADTSNNLFRKVTTAGVVTIFSGSPVNPETLPINIGSADGAPDAARFHIGDFASSGGAYDPPIFTIVGSVTLGRDSSGNVYFADTMNNTIRRITPAGVVSTIAGSPGGQGSDDGTGGNARFLAPAGVAVDSSGNIYVADSGNFTIRKITPAGVVTTLAGTARAGGSTNATGAAARFLNPSGIAVDANGNLYVTDTANHTIRKITSGGVVTTLAGSPGSAGTADGAGSQARFSEPTGIAVDAAGNVYVADTGNHAIRKISPGGTVSTIAGAKGTSGSADGTGTAALFNEPHGITVDASGSLYIADTGNNTIRRAVTASTTDSLQVTAVPPSLIQVTTSTAVTFKVVASGSPTPSYQWFKDGVAISGATGASYTINSTSLASSGTYHVVVTSGSLAFNSALTQLQVFATGTPVPSVTIVTQPTDRLVNAGQSATFAVEASAASALTYQWTFNGAPITGATGSSYTISSAQTENAGSYVVQVSDGTTTVSTSPATLQINGAPPPVAPVITTNPTAQSVATGGTATFTVAASGSPAPTIQWQKDGVALANGSNISGATTATLTITGVSAADAGSYRAVATNAGGSVTSTAATLTVTTAEPANRGRIGNISALTSLNANEDFTFGFFVGGDGTTGGKPVLMRAMGPSLNAIIGSGGLPDPSLEFYDGDTKVLENNDWAGDTSVQAATTRLQAFAFESSTSKDAALYKSDVSTSVGHSIKIKSGTGAGTVIAELYDGSETMTTTTPRLINVSLRKHVGNKTTLGFFILGSNPVRVLIRAIGPTLGDFGVGDTIADPKMDVFVLGASTPFASNDNWGGGAELSAAFDSVLAFQLPASSKDAATIQTLNPGGYTVEVSSAVPNASGVALIEVYELP